MAMISFVVVVLDRYLKGFCASAPQVLSLYPYLLQRKVGVQKLPQYRIQSKELPLTHFPV